MDPLVSYLEAIENIDSMEEMTQYLINADMSNLSAEDFVNAFIAAPIKTRDYYTVYITFTEHQMLTDFLVTLVVLYILSFIMGIYLNLHQLGFLFINGLGVIVLVACSISLLMPLIFRTQNMVLALIGYFILVSGIPSSAVSILARLGPEFLQNLQLEQYFHDSVINLAMTNAIQGAF